ncbi:MAG TPA: YkgJ family cysteine cluster protein [Phenylobacterium sp.]
MCCKLLRIEELQKLPGDWCVHVLRGKGCGIYESRPAPCRSFLCYWMLQPKLDDAWRPDRCGFLLRDVGKGVMLVEVEPSKPDAWKRQPYYDQLKRWSQATLAGQGMVVVKVRGAATVVMPDADLFLGRVLDSDDISVGYEAHGGGRRAVATVTAADGAVRQVRA